MKKDLQEALDLPRAVMALQLPGVLTKDLQDALDLPRLVMALQLLLQLVVVEQDPSCG